MKSHADCIQNNNEEIVYTWFVLLIDNLFLLIIEPYAAFLQSEQPYVTIITFQPPSGLKEMVSATAATNDNRPY